MNIDFALVWAALIAFAVMAYVVLDGFDLGIGILFPFFSEETERDRMMNTVAPVWDGNETWLVLGGGGLFAVFPLAYAIIMPALYMPIFVMLLALVFRGVAFEFRWRATDRRYLWNWAFTFGSTLATFCQGVALGGLVQGITVSGRAYAGTGWDWITPFSVNNRICTPWLDMVGAQNRGGIAGARSQVCAGSGCPDLADDRDCQRLDAFPA